MQKETLHKWIEQFFRVFLFLCAFSYVLAYLYIVYSRIRYPFELEWMEGGSLLQLLRMLQGEKLYVAPTLEYVPFIYQPLYFYLSTLAAKVVGGSFLPLRLVSFLSTLGCFTLIFLLVKRETHSRLSAFLAACLFAATFRISGAWFDVARVDSLFLFLFLAGIFFMGSESRKAYVLAGICFALAFFTKQTALLALLPLAIYAVATNWRRSLALIIPVGVLIVTGTLILDTVYDGWYSYYTFDLPAQHQILPSRAEFRLQESLLASLNFLNKNLVLQKFWIGDILKPMPFASLLALLALSATDQAGKAARIFYGAALLGMVGISWIARINPGGYNNVLIPAYAILAILFGLGIAEALKFTGRIQSRWLLSPKTFLYILCIFQFGLLIYSIPKQIPTQDDLVTGQELVEMLSETEGDIWMPFSGYLAVMAGKDGSAHDMALCELKGCFGGPETEIWENDIGLQLREAIENQTFSLIIFSGTRWKKTVKTNYIEDDIWFQERFGDMFWPVTGWRIRPTYLFSPMGAED